MKQTFLFLPELTSFIVVDCFKLIIKLSKYVLKWDHSFLENKQAFIYNHLIIILCSPNLEFIFWCRIHMAPFTDEYLFIEIANKVCKQRAFIYICR